MTALLSLVRSERNYRSVKYRPFSDGELVVQCEGRHTGVAGCGYDATGWALIHIRLLCFRAAFDRTAAQRSFEKRNA
jgi:hypothetical protein